MTAASLYYAPDAAPPGAAVVWQPLRVDPALEGFQERCLKSQADELFIGGAKGPGKTDVLLELPIYHAHLAHYAAVFVREHYSELKRPLDRAHAVYGRLPLHQRPAWNGDSQRFTWPSGAFVQFGHARTVQELGWTQGGNWDTVLYDEVGNQPDERVIDTLIAELRGNASGAPKQFVGSGNPGFAGHPWLKRRYVIPCGRKGEKIAWRRVVLENGRIAYRSLQFVPGRVSDNPILMADDAYMAILSMLPERMRRCLLNGDWDAATGAALDEVDAGIHIVPPFDIPVHWPYIAGFDWGFTHPAVFIWGRVSDDGRVYVCDVLKRRLMRDWDLAGVIEELVPAGARVNIQSGTDVKAKIQARELTKSTVDTFQERHIHLAMGNTARVQGYRNMLAYLSWRQSEYMPQRQPRVQFFDTPGCRWLIEDQLPAMVLDPDDPRDVLKVDANPETGEGGDDGYDALRVMLASRMMVAKSGYEEIALSAFDPEILRAEADRARRGTSRPMQRSRRRRYF